jgi:hypothetical protein
MGYRDDFYMVQNIIGYSGNLNDFPTVYFQTKDEYGHITQKHPDPQNVGRMEVYKSTGYSIGNEMVGSTLKLVEKVNGKIIHESRSTLTKVDTFAPGNKETVALLAQSIYNRDTGEKYISSYSRKDFAKIDATADAKAKVLAQIEQRGKVG